MSKTNAQGQKMIPDHETILKMIETVDPSDTANA